MKAGQSRKTKIKAWASIIIAILCFIGGFAVLVVGAIMQHQGKNVDVDLMMASSLGCMLLALVACILGWKDSLQWEIEKQTAQYAALPLARLTGTGSAQVLAAFRAQGFQEAGEGYLRHRLSTFGKGPICCYLRCVPALGVSDSLISELQRLDRLGEENGWVEPKKSGCLFLFLCQEGVTEADKQTLREASESFLLQERLVPVSVFHTCLPVLLDETTGEGWFLDMPKGISVYSYACRRLRKIVSNG